MGTNTWMLVYTDGNVSEILQSKPILDRDASIAFAKQLFPSDALFALEDSSLADTGPRDNTLMVGCFPGLKIVATEEFQIEQPSQLPTRYLQPEFGKTVYLHVMHSVVDWFACAIWNKGSLQRSLSLAPNYGITENIGAPLAFEQAYWAGKHPVADAKDQKAKYPFSFHPLELAEAALGEFFGYQLEAPGANHLVDPANIPLMHFKFV